MTPKPQPPVSVTTSAQINIQQPQTSRKDAVSSNNFWDTYEHLCALQNVMPLQSLKSCLSSESGAILNLNADKLKSADWEPIFSALKSNNKSLKQISIISNYTENDTTNESNRLIKGFSKLKKPPSIRNKDRINKLCRCLKESLQISIHLNTLELYNIPLLVKDLAQIAKGLKSNKSLKILSMDRCLIGDEGLAIICKDIQSSNNLNRINFSSCNLTHDGAEILANLIKVQALKRHNEAWKDSLRYGRPDLDSMFGIRRITINSNPLIGDKGVHLLSEAFKSDLWLKALDLQDCGITTIGANYLLDGLKFNAMMHVLDVRLNIDIDRDTLQKIMEQVMINSSGHSTDYEWMDLTQAAAISITNINNNNAAAAAATTSKSSSITTTQAARLRVKKRRNTNLSFSKKAQFIQNGNQGVIQGNNNNNNNNSHYNSIFRMKRCKSTGSVVINNNNNPKSPKINNNNNNNRQDHHNNHHHHRQSLHIASNSGNTPPAAAMNGGIPWRTAARADRYRVSSSCAYRKVIPSSSSSLSFFKFENNNNNNDDLNDEDKEREDDDDDDDDNNDDDENNDHDDDDDEQIEQIETTDKNLRHRMRNLNLMTINSTMMDNKTSTSSLLINNDLVTNIDRIKNVSVKDLLNILQREQQSKTQLEDMLLQLQDENTKLKSQLKHQNTKATTTTTTSNLNRTLLDDDKALEIIELTLYKYQNFLDFLRNAGFGKLIEIGEMDQKEQNKQRQQQIRKKKQPISPQPQSKLTNEQKYYFDKISKTKRNQNILESTQVSSSSNNNNNNKRNKLGATSSNIDLFDNISIDGLENHHIDTLLPNALEISRSYRDRLNSSSVNNSTVATFNNTTLTNNNNNNNKNKNQMILSGIKENITNETLYDDDNDEEEEDNKNDDFFQKNGLIVNINDASSSPPLQKENNKPTNNSITTSTISPTTTVIANNQHQQQPPIVSARKSLHTNSTKSITEELEQTVKKSESDKKESELSIDFEEDEEEEEEEEEEEKEDDDEDDNQ